MEEVDAWRRAGERLALVPTMGALHAGHMALVARARTEADRVVVSIFVNPKQFGPGEDLARYPRRLEADRAMLADAGVDAVFAPSEADIYPPGFATTVHVGRLGDVLDGAARPGHFDGVATVVARLFGLVRPDVAVFGEKDWQQLRIIHRMVADLALPVGIVGHPTVRELDGLALSSRNAYLSADERARAPMLHAVLIEAADGLRRGVAYPLGTAQAQLTGAGFALDYLALTDADDLSLRIAPPGRLLVAARLGTTRLIDNIAV